jgi:hypothetical protein
MSEATATGSIDATERQLSKLTGKKHQLVQEQNRFHEENVSLKSSCSPQKRILKGTCL